MQGPKRFWAERLKPYAARGQPHACSLCRDRILEKIGFEARSVVHADLIPTTVGIQLFRAMPASVKGKALLAALTGKGEHLEEFALPQTSPCFSAQVGTFCHPKTGATPGDHGSTC